MFNPTNPNQQPGVGFNPAQPVAPQYPQVLTGAEYAILSKKLNDNLLSLKIDERETAVALCPHRDVNNRSTLYVGEDGKHHCSLCGAAFEFRSYTAEECERITNEMIALLQVCKTATMDHPIEFFRNFYVMIPLLQKIPALYQNISSAVNNYYNSQNNFSMISPINPVPDAFFAANNALFGNWQQPMMPPQGQYMGQPNPAQGQYMGQQGYPVYPSQPGYNPMAYGNPTTTPAANPAAPAAPVAPAPGAMPAPSANPTGATGGEVIQTKTMNV